MCFSLLSTEQRVSPSTPKQWVSLTCPPEQWVSLTSPPEQWVSLSSPPEQWIFLSSSREQWILFPVLQSNGFLSLVVLSCGFHLFFQQEGEAEDDSRCLPTDLRSSNVRVSRDSTRPIFFTIKSDPRLKVLGFCRPVIDQNFYYAGLKFTSPTFSCAMSNILPAITFLMALLCR